MSSIVASFFNGFLDAISFHNVVLFILTSKTIRMRALQCLILNGVIFLGSIMLVHALASFLFFCLLLMFSILWGCIQAEWFVIPFLKHLVTLDSAADGELSAMVQTAFVFLYQTFWIYPIYALSFVLNTIWYQDIAEYAFVIHGHKTKKAELSFATWLQAISEEIYRALLIGCYFIQITLFSFIPYVGTFIFGAYLSWLYALYSFEYDHFIYIEFKFINLFISKNNLFLLNSPGIGGRWSAGNSNENFRFLKVDGRTLLDLVHFFVSCLRFFCASLICLVYQQAARPRCSLLFSRTLFRKASLH
jgi:etoposide-induced 2.4 mRNA